ncbi:U-box domain-containing protein 33-like [Phragmites australis]|uniref:U-box domain-containing protein 33-like n=1 Tax=Phragmites australis TaxID=29695 RepID=UPI002D7955E6|nr:U-box domain-containing protein 33-like [Phragmites australis]
MWVLSNMDAILMTRSNDKKKEVTVVLLHVHRPAKTIPVMGANFPADQLHEAEVSAFRQAETQAMNRDMAKYRAICARVKVPATCKVLTDAVDDVAQGILRLVAQHGITRLVIGAAADKRYTKKMTAPSSKTALSVQQQAHPLCNIWFLCKGNLICTRLAAVNVIPRNSSNPAVVVRASSSSSQLSGDEAAAESHANAYARTHTRRPAVESSSSPRGQSVQLGSFIQSLRNDDGSNTFFNYSNGDGEPPSISDKFSSATNSDRWDGDTETEKQHPASSWSQHADGIFPAPNTRYTMAQQRVEVGERNNDVYYYKQDIGNIFAEAEKLGREDHNPAVTLGRHHTADSSHHQLVFQVQPEHAMRQAGAGAQVVEQLAVLRDQQDMPARKMKQELEMAQQQRAELEAQVLSSKRVINDLQEKLSEAHCMLFSLERDQDDLRRQRDAAVREAAALRDRVRQLEQELLLISTSNDGGGFTELSYDELQEATNNLDETLKLGQGGGYGTVYKAILHTVTSKEMTTVVAVKVLNPQGMQGLSHFQQQVDELSKLRHPNVVPLLGACPAPEAWALVYEFLPGGSLEDRLGGMLWPDRTRIAAEICSALVFLHQNNMVHGDLKPSNVLLNAGLTSKLADSGLCRLLEPDASAVMVRCMHTTSTGGTSLAYMDPEFLASGELRPSSDVYAFGVLLLRLLTGRPAMGLVKQVQTALAEGRLPGIMDASAGEWPYTQEQGEQLAQLGVTCCEIASKNRPDLAGEVVAHILGCFHQ